MSNDCRDLCVATFCRTSHSSTLELTDDQSLVKDADFRQKRPQVIERPAQVSEQSNGFLLCPHDKSSKAGWRNDLLVGGYSHSINVTDSSRRNGTDLVEFEL